MHGSADFCRRARRLHPACAQHFNYSRNQRNDNYRHNYQREVFLHDLAVCKPVTRGDEEADPENCSGDAVKQEFQIIHLSDSRNEWGKSADDRHKPCKYNGLSTIFFIKLMRAHKVSPIKPARTLAFEYFWPDKIPNPIIGRIAYDRSQAEQ